MLIKTFEALYHDELRDLYDAEWQIISALPLMIEAVSSAELKAAFEQHLQETKQQLTRLERVFTELNEPPAGKRCHGISAVLAQGKVILNEMPASPVRDAALISAAQKVEHYEITGYGTARTRAEMLSQEKAAALLQRTLDEEKETDSVLTDIAESVLGGEALEDAEEK